MFSRCVIDYKHLLIQLWINRVTAEGALLSTLNRFCCRFSTWNTSVPCSWLLSRPSQGACHLSCGACTSYTRCPQYMSSDAHKHTNIKKFLGTSMQWHKRSHTNSCSRARTVSSLWTHSFLLQQHKSYQASCQGNGREKYSGGEWQRKDGMALAAV